MHTDILLVVEFNEDLSALHGPTLQTQARYVAEAIEYILQKYPHRPKITLIGHSMGGIVAQLALASEHLSPMATWNASSVGTIITMSTPHGLPPARLDTEMARIYKRISSWEHISDPTTIHPPILALCGGSTDSQIPSETCALPKLATHTHENNVSRRYRRTVHTTSCPGIWSGVGHQEMVWCHQVRWRVARAILDSYRTNLFPSTDVALDRWLPPPQSSSFIHPSTSSTTEDLSDIPHTLLEVSRLHLNSNALKQSSQPYTHLLPIPKILGSSQLGVLVSGGTFLTPSIPESVPSHHTNSLRVSLYHCATSSSLDSCTTLPSSLILSSHARLLPNPRRNEKFPSKEGADESDGALFLSLGISPSLTGWIAILVEGGRDDNAFVLVEFDAEKTIEVHPSSMSTYARGGLITIGDSRSGALMTKLVLPEGAVSKSALVVYTAEVRGVGNCAS